MIMNDGDDDGGVVTMVVVLMMQEPALTVVNEKWRPNNILSFYNEFPQPRSMRIRKPSKVFPPPLHHQGVVGESGFSPPNSRRVGSFSIKSMSISFIDN